MDQPDWDAIENFLMRVDASEIMMFCVMEHGMSFELTDDDRGFRVEDIPPNLLPQRDMLERVFAARRDDIVLYIRTGGSSLDIPTGSNAVIAAERLLSSPDD